MRVTVRNLVLYYEVQVIFMRKACLCQRIYSTLINTLASAVAIEKTNIVIQQLYQFD